MYDHVNQMNDGGHALLMLGIVNIHMCFIRIRLETTAKWDLFLYKVDFSNVRKKWTFVVFENQTQSGNLPNSTHYSHFEAGF